MGWNFGDMLDAISPVMPADAPAVIHGERTIFWPEFTERSNRLARALIAGGAKPGDKVAFYMRNRSEYVETLAACFKARLTHVNVNYRYRADEVFYIFDNSDAQAVVYGSEFRDILAEIHPRLTKVGQFVEVSDTGEVAPFAKSYESLATTGDASNLTIERSSEDEFFIYTGGTTGMPKGVIWTHDALRETQLIALRRLGPAPETMPELIADDPCERPRRASPAGLSADAWHGPVDGAVGHDQWRLRHHPEGAVPGRRRILGCRRPPQGRRPWSSSAMRSRGRCCRPSKPRRENTICPPSSRSCPPA